MNSSTDECGWHAPDGSIESGSLDDGIQQVLSLLPENIEESVTRALDIHSSISELSTLFMLWGDTDSQRNLDNDLDDGICSIGENECQVTQSVIEQQEMQIEAFTADDDALVGHLDVGIFSVGEDDCQMIPIVKEYQEVQMEAFTADEEAPVGSTRDKEHFVKYTVLKLSLIHI